MFRYIHKLFIICILSHLTGVTLNAQEVALSWLNSGWPYNINFGGWSGDYFMELYIPPADGYATSIQFEMADIPDVLGGTLDVAIFSATYPWYEINTQAIANDSLGSWLGYYTDNESVNIIGDEWVYGGINDIEGADSIFRYDPLGDQLWPESGSGNIPLIPDVDDRGTLILDLMEVGGDYFYFTLNDPFLVVVRLSGFEGHLDETEYRTGFLTAEYPNDPQPCAKFYNTISSPEGRTGSGDWGWHIRSYVWDWSVNVILSSSDPYLFFDLDDLSTTLSTEDRLVSVEISDHNPSGTDDFIDSVSLGYRVDGVPSAQIEMAGGNNVYTTSIPGQVSGSEVEYWVEVVDINGDHQSSEVKTYWIFAPTEPMLLVYDAVDLPGEEWRYMEGLDSSLSQHYDLWQAAYGPISTELVNEYSIIYHVMAGTFGPQVYNISPVYYQWLENGTIDNEHCLLLSGQDYGFISGFADSTFSSSSFEGGYLGLDALGPQDINYDGTRASYEDPYAVSAAVNNSLTGMLAEYESENLQLFYEPLRELGFSNWIDNMTASIGTVCLTDPNQDDAAVAVYNSGPGWKTSFWAIDPLGLNYYDPADTSSAYISAVDAVGNPVVNIFEWFRGAISITSVDETEIPMTTRLHTSYPNPFNPLANIAYELAAASDVNITVYNMLGQEVARLVAEFQTAGAYMVQWNGSDQAGHSVSSGLYFYTMRAEGFSATQKMMLLK